MQLSGRNITRMVRNFLASKPSIHDCKIAMIADDRATLVCRGSEDDADALVIWVMSQAEANRLEHLRDYMSNAIEMIEQDGYLTFSRRARELFSLVDRKT